MGTLWVPFPWLCPAPGRRGPGSPYHAGGKYFHTGKERGRLLMVPHGSVPARGHRGSPVESVAGPELCRLRLILQGLRVGWGGGSLRTRLSREARTWILSPTLPHCSGDTHTVSWKPELGHSLAGLWDRGMGGKLSRKIIQHHTIMFHFSLLI